MGLQKKELEKLSEQEILKRYKLQSETEYVGEIFVRYMPLIYGLCLKLLKNKAESEDATMGIFELLAKKLKTQNVDNFKSWLYTVSKNYCFEILRQKQRTLTKEKDFSIVQSEAIFHPDDVNDDEEIFEKLENCISLLPDLQKVIIRMFYYEKKSYQEIVDKEGLSWKQVRSNIQNGRRNLKNCMEQK